MTCRYFGISRDTFYRWKRDYIRYGESGLVTSKPCPKNPKRRTPPEIEVKIIYLRKTYHLGQQRISWYLKRYHDIKISQSTVRNVIVTNGLNLLPRSKRNRSMISRYKGYEKQVPGHRIQVDVKFLDFDNNKGQKVRRYQYTAIDDATRIRALKTFKRHTQANAVKCI